MSDNPYAVAGFAQGFGQGLGLMNDQEKLHMEKERAFREKTEYDRKLTQDELRGAFAEIQGLEEAQQNGTFVHPDNYKKSVDRINETFKKRGLPPVGEYYKPEFGQWIDTGQKVASGQMDINDPQANQALNWRFKDQIDIGQGEKLSAPLKGQNGVIPKGAVREHTKVNRMIPGPNGTLVPDMEIHFTWKDKDGKEHIDSALDPMTYERSVHPDDKFIRGIPAEHLFDQHASDTAFYQAFNDPSVKSGVMNKYLAAGGKLEDLQDKSNKYTYKEMNYTDKNGKVYTGGVGVLDQKGNLVRYVGGSDPRETTPYLKMIDSVRLKSSLSRGQQNSVYDKLTKIFMGQINPETKQNYTEAEAGQLALQWQWNKEVQQKVLPIVAKQLVADANFKGESVNDIYQKLMSDASNVSSNFSGPGLNPNAPTETPPSAKPHGTPTHYNKNTGEYFDANTGERWKANDNGAQVAPVPKPSQPKPGVSKPKRTNQDNLDEANLEYWKRILADPKTSRETYNEATIEVQKLQQKMGLKRR